MDEPSLMENAEIESINTSVISPDEPKDYTGLEQFENEELQSLLAEQSEDTDQFQKVQEFIKDETSESFRHLQIFKDSSRKDLSPILECQSSISPDEPKETFELSIEYAEKTSKVDYQECTGDSLRTQDRKSIDSDKQFSGSSREIFG